MNNYAVARVFWRIADLMEIQGESFFKIRAYRNAAETMQELTESLEVLAERGALQTIPGVGEAIAAKTRDILATGTTKLYEQLRAEVPESLIELLKLPGFGPKKILTVWKELGVRTLDDLECAVLEQRLRTVSGFSAKSEENVSEAIASARRRRERKPIFVAAPYAEALVRLFMETRAFGRLEVAGSVRRRQDLVGDINLVGTATADAAGALEAVASHAETAEVLSRGADEICIRTQTGLLADVRLAAPALFGAALQRFTGSREHNEQLGRLLGPDTPGATEEEVYRRAGLS